MQKIIKMPNAILCYGIIFYVFMSIFVPGRILYWTLMLAICDIIYIVLRRKIKVKINSTIILWFIFTLISILGLIIEDFGPSKIDSTGQLYYIITLIMVLLNYTLLISDVGWEEFIIKIVVRMSILFVAGSIIQFFIPDLLIMINSYRLTTIRQIESTNFIRLGRLVGFTTNTGINAFVMIPSLLHFFIRMISAKNKPQKFVSFILFLIILILLVYTGKRSIFIFIFIILFYLFMSFSTHKIISFLPTVLFITIIFFITINTDMGQFMIEKTLNQEDITTGRLLGYIQMWEDFLESPIIGKGTYTTDSVLSITNGHNIYLQVLRENGIIGFIPFFSVLVINLFANNKLLKQKELRIDRYLLGMSSSIQILFILWGFTENPLYDRYPLMLYFVAVAVFWNLKRYSNKKVNFK